MVNVNLWHLFSRIKIWIKMCFSCLLSCALAQLYTYNVCLLCSVPKSEKFFREFNSTIRLGIYNRYIFQWNTFLSFLLYKSYELFTLPNNLLPNFNCFSYNCKDATTRIWDTLLSQCKLTLSSHLQSITCVKWSGENLIFSSSQDRTIKVWNPDEVSLFLLSLICKIFKKEYILNDVYALFCISFSFILLRTSEMY